jgi:hypothetical protein
VNITFRATQFRRMWSLAGSNHCPYGTTTAHTRHLHRQAVRSIVRR